MHGREFTFLNLRFGNTTLALGSDLALRGAALTMLVVLHSADGVGEWEFVVLAAVELSFVLKRLDCVVMRKGRKGKRG